MKSLLLALTFVFTSQTAFAQKVDTLFNCVSEDADQMIEVGIEQNDGPGFTMYVIDINHDREPIKKHVDTIRGVFKKSCGERACYTNDGYNTVRLAVSNDYRFAVLSLLKDGSGGFRDMPMECYTIDSEVEI